MHLGSSSALAHPDFRNPDFRNPVGQQPTLEWYRQGDEQRHGRPQSCQTHRSSTHCSDRLPTPGLRPHGGARRI